MALQVLEIAALWRVRSQELVFTGNTATPPPSLLELTARLGYGLVRNHGFVDGNKRTAFIAVFTFLAIKPPETAQAQLLSWLQGVTFPMAKPRL
ncbi:MAG: Fic family protein [Cyanobium sp.]